jgi:hypothetical protein
MTQRSAGARPCLEGASSSITDRSNVVVWFTVRSPCEYAWVTCMPLSKASPREGVVAVRCMDATSDAVEVAPGGLWGVSVGQVVVVVGLCSERLPAPAVK